MVRWPLTLVLFALAGCFSSPAATDNPRSPGPAPPTQLHEFTGSLTGVGVVSPTEVSFTGVSTRSQDFIVKDGALRIRFVLTWNPAADLYLDVDGPAGRVFLDHQLPGSLIESRIEYAVEEPAPGQWSTMAWAQGPAVVDYLITVTIDYATT